jgi:hypothetical protein
MSTSETIAHLRELLRRCASGPSDRFPECPICLEKWLDGEEQPHKTGCELQAAVMEATEYGDARAAEFDPQTTRPPAPLSQLSRPEGADEGGKPDRRKRLLVSPKA